MQPSRQRHRILREFETEPFRTWAILTKCGAGLAIVFLIALVGVFSTDNQEHIARAKLAAPPAARPAQEHRQQVFDERRRRFKKGDSPNNVAGEPARPANRLALMPGE